MVYIRKMVVVIGTMMNKAMDLEGTSFSDRPFRYCLFSFCISLMCQVDKERKLVAVGDMEKGETVFKIPRPTP